MDRNGFIGRIGKSRLMRASKSSVLFPVAVLPLQGFNLD